MDTRQMRWVLAVAAHRSFAKAADALGVSQPNLSNAIARLEDRLGGRLFVRTPMGSELTPFAEAILPRIAGVVAEIDEIRAEAQLIARGDHGALRVGLGAMLPNAFSSEFVSAVAQAHPSAQFSFLVLERERILCDLQKGDLDLAICAEGDGLDAEHFATIPVLKSEMIVVASPGHPLASRAHISEDDFYSHPHASICVPSYSADRLIPRPKRASDAGRIEANAYALLLPPVLGGAATLIAPEYVAGPHLSKGTLIQLSVRMSAWARFCVIARKPLMSMQLVRSALSTAEGLGARFGQTSNAEYSNTCAA